MLNGSSSELTPRDGLTFSFLLTGDGLPLPILLDLNGLVGLYFWMSDSLSESSPSESSPSERSESSSEVEVSSKAFHVLKGSPSFFEGLIRWVDCAMLSLPRRFEIISSSGLCFYTGWEDIRVAITCSENIGYDLFFRRGLGVTIHHDIPIRLCSFAMIDFHKSGFIFGKDLFCSTVHLLTITEATKHDGILCIAWNVRVLFSFRKHILQQ